MRTHRLVVSTKQLFSFILHLGRAGLWAFALAVLGWYLLRWWPGDRFWPVRLGNFIMPWLLAGLLPGLLAAALARRVWLAAALALPALFIGVTYAPLFLPRGSVALAEQHPITVMSYNVWGRNRNTAAITGVVGQVRPDILLLQEVKPAAARKIKTSLSGLYPRGELFWVYEPAIGQAVASRYPVVSSTAEPQKGRVQKVVLRTPAGPVAVWNVHTNHPFPWSRQYRQLAALTADIAAEDMPLIVGGDFNTTDQSETYRLVNRYLRNAHWDAGWGFGFSFPARTRLVKKLPLLTPVVRIDHIFYSNHFFARSARTLTRAGGSDHFPVVAEFSLTR